MNEGRALLAIGRALCSAAPKEGANDMGKLYRASGVLNSETAKFVKNLRVNGRRP